MRGKCGANVALYARAGEGVRGKSAYTRPPKCGRVWVPRGEESTTYRGNFMIAKKVSSAAICPFYRYESLSGAPSIICDGASGARSTKIVYSDTETRAKQLEKHCYSWRYDRCPYFRMISAEFEAEKA